MPSRVVDGTIIPLWAALGARPELPDLSPRSEARRRAARTEEPGEHRAATGATTASARPVERGAATEVTQTVTRPAVEPRAEPSTLGSQTRGGPPEQEPLEHAGLDALLAEVEAEQTRQPQTRSGQPQNLADAARPAVTRTALDAHNKTEVLCNHCGGRLTHGDPKCPHCGGQATHALHSPPPKMQMEMTPPKKQHMKRAPMTPRVKHTTAFGAVLHVLKGQPKPQGCCGSEHHVMTLFEGGIQSQSIDTDCCGMYSHTFVNVIPKHSIIGGDRRETRGHGSRTD